MHTNIRLMKLNIPVTNIYPTNTVLLKITENNCKHIVKCSLIFYYVVINKLLL